MTSTTIAPTGAVSNRLARRGLLAGAGLLAAAAAAPGPNPIPSTILASGLQLKGCWELYDSADAQDDIALERSAWSALKRHENTILTTAPTTMAECAVVLLVALGEIDSYNACEDSRQDVAASVRKADVAMLRLFDLAKLDVLDFGGGAYVAPSVLEGRAAA